MIYNITEMVNHPKLPMAPSLCPCETICACVLPVGIILTSSNPDYSLGCSFDHLTSPYRMFIMWRAFHQITIIALSSQRGGWMSFITSDDEFIGNCCHFVVNSSFVAILPFFRVYPPLFGMSGWEGRCVV